MALRTRENRLITLEGWLRGSSLEYGGVRTEELHGGRSRRRRRSGCLRQTSSVMENRK